MPVPQPLRTSLQEILRAIKRRTGNTNPKVQFLALTLLEMGVKNCGHVFRQELCHHKDLLNDVLQAAITRRVLGMMQRARGGLRSWFCCPATGGGGR